MLFICLLAPQALRASPPELVDASPLIRNFSADEIGTASKVRCLLETPEGILYAGADRLLIYDGSAWSQAKVDNTSEIRSLCQEGGRIWAGGINEVGYFDRNAGGEYVYHSVTAQLGDAFFGTVSSLFLLGDELVMVTERKVVQYPLKGGAPKFSDLPNDSRLRASLVNDTLYINQRLNKESKIWMVRNGQLEPVRSLFELDAHNRVPLGRIDDRWVIGYESTLFARDINTGTEKAFYIDNGEVVRAALTGVNICHNKHVYITTRAGGLFIIDLDGRVQQVGKSQGLASDSCNFVFGSQAGGVWVATDEGVSFVHDDEFASWLPLPGQVRAIFGDRNQLYVSHVLSALLLTKERRVEMPGLLWATWARLGDTLYAASSNKIFAGKYGSGEFSELPGVEEQKIGSIVGGHGPSNSLYAAVTVTSGVRGLMRMDPRTGQKTTIEVPEGLAYYLQDNAGRMWVSTTAGNVMAIDDELRRGTLQLASRKRSRLTLHEGEPLVLTDDSGFTTVKGEKVRSSERVSNATGTEGTEGPAWIGARSDDLLRVGVVAAKDGALTWERKNIPGLRRFKTINALYRSGDDLWIGGETGVIQVDIRKLQGPDFSLPSGAEVSIRNTATKEQRMVHLGAKPILLRNSEQEFAIKLKTRVWGLMEPPQYESRLLPLEDEWTLHRYGETIGRKNLPAGRYTLQLRVRHLGESGPVMTFEVHRPLPWYFSYAGISLFTVTLSLLFYGAVKLRTRRISARNRELEQKIFERTQELARANAAKSEFLAAMSHEIRNPMNGVIGIAKILQEAKLGAREKYYLTTLHRCAEQLRTTVDDVLDFSKIEAGQLTLHLDTFDLAECINSTISAVDLTGSRLELTSWAGPKPTVTGDQGKFAQIMTNYFNNALKYGVPPSATVDVYVLNEGPNRIRLTLAVKNTGPDIPQHEQATIFESFTRGEYAKRGRIGGSGLGLSICKKFAEAMGGSVSVASAGGVTVFQVTLPFDLAYLRQKSDDDTPASRGLHARALAIEDEDYNRLVLGNILAKLGYRVDWACDGKTALQLVQQNGYDLILTDLMLPDTDGGTLTQQILACSEEPKPPIFAVTAYSTKEKEDDCIKAGMAGFISKPITVEKLEAALQGWADRHRTRARPLMEQNQMHAAVSVQQLAKLGPLAVVLTDFTRKIEREWTAVDRLLEDRDCIPAANGAHKLVSAMLLIDANVAADQLRLLESRLRDGALESEIEKVRGVCRDEVLSVVDALKAELRRLTDLNGAPSQK